MQEPRVCDDRDYVRDQVQNYVGGRKDQCAGLNDGNVAGCHRVNHQLTDAGVDNAVAQSVAQSMVAKLEAGGPFSEEEADLIAAFIRRPGTNPLRDMPKRMRGFR